MSGYVIGADIGSSCLKVALVHSDLGVISIAEQAYPMHRPQPFWAENDANDWYFALAKGIPQVLQAGGVAPEEVVALCLVGQRDIAVLLDESGEVLTPVIHWTDRRDPDETSEFYDRIGREQLIDRSGTLPIPGLWLPNLVWTKSHLPEVWAKVRNLLTPKDFLAYKLTGDIGTDPTGPTRSMMNDWRNESWSEQTCADLDVPVEFLPEVKYRSWEPRGVLGKIAFEIGLVPGTTLVAGGGDDPAAALGSGVINPGDISIGTGSSMSWRVVDSQPRHDPTGLIGLMPHVVPNAYLHEMVAVGTGTTLRWFREAFGDALPFDELINQAARIDMGSEGLLCYPFVEGASVPYQDDKARATFYGIASQHGRSHFVRSVLEAISYQYPSLLEVVKSRGLPVGTLTISDGEARSQVWNQIKADVLGVSITPAARVEAPALGAAILAGIATGQFSSFEESVEIVVELGEPIIPNPISHDLYTELRVEWERLRNIVYPDLVK
jgi:xylulokinase